MNNNETRQPGWQVVMTTELRRLWLGWRGPLLLFAFALFLSIYMVLLAFDPEINVLSQRKMINLTIQATVLVGIVVVLLLGADSFSGERDQRSLENLLLTPVPRRQLVIGKLLAILSLWLGMVPLAIPYVTLVAKGTDVGLASVMALIVPGTLLVALSAGIGVFVSSLSPTNLVSFAVSFMVMLLLTAPTQLPGSVQDYCGESNNGRCQLSIIRHRWRTMDQGADIAPVTYHRADSGGWIRASFSQRPSIP